MSGIYIKGMKMPRRCIACPIGFFDNKYDIVHCPLTGEEIHRTDFVYKRSENCPLIPVPEHGRLGDLDKLEQMFVDIDNAPYSGFDGSEPFYSAEDAAQIIRLSPTIIPAEEVDTHDNC